MILYIVYIIIAIAIYSLIKKFSPPNNPEFEQIQEWEIDQRFK